MHPTPRPLPALPSTPLATAPAQTRDPMAALDDAAKEIFGEALFNVRPRHVERRK